MYSYAVSDPTLSYLTMAIPTVAVLLLWWSIWFRRASYRRRFSGWRLLWEMWGSTLLITIVLLGIFYWYLFWHPFYQLAVTPDNLWVMEYVFPHRSVSIDPAHIQELHHKVERIPFIRMSDRQYIEITLKDGRVLRSAALAGKNSNAIFSELQRLLANQ